MRPVANHAATQSERDAEAKNITSFSDLPPSIQQELEQISFPLRYPGGSKLFVDGEPPRGVFILRNGRVKLYVCSGEGKTLILRMAKSGDVLGIPGTLAGRQYEVTAETVGPCEVAFIKRDAFLRLMYAHKELCIAVAHEVTNNYIGACQEICWIGLSHSAAEKLANLLLEWPMVNGDTPSRMKFVFRHEEVAQMIGTSRETVSRLFTEFKRKHIAELNGSTLLIRNRPALQAIAAGAPLSEQNGTDGHSDSHFHPDGV
ncbi:MAG: Crp/Fnr family transcriptional regulator [Acidobacteriia bacterium]|nr:Crp/Fnr family transcriptional regulator [Terriglobia bacterium]